MLKHPVIKPLLVDPTRMTSDVHVRPQPAWTTDELRILQRESTYRQLWSTDDPQVDLLDGLVDVYWRHCTNKILTNIKNVSTSEEDLYFF